MKKKREKTEVSKKIVVESRPLSANPLTKEGPKTIKPAPTLMSRVSRMNKLIASGIVTAILGAGGLTSLSLRSSSDTGMEPHPAELQKTASSKGSDGTQAPKAPTLPTAPLAAVANAPVEVPKPSTPVKKAKSVSQGQSKSIAAVKPKKKNGKPTKTLASKKLDKKTMKKKTVVSSSKTKKLHTTDKQKKTIAAKGN